MTDRQFAIAASPTRRWLRSQQADARDRLDAARILFASISPDDWIVKAAAGLRLQQAIAVAAEWDVGP